MEERIGFTRVKLPYGWLGNMSPHPIVIDGTVWKTSEAAFQAMRFTNSQIREEIRLQRSPFSAKLVAKSHREKVHVVPCSKQDVENMRQCLLLKLEFHPHLATELIATGEAVLFEDVTSRGDRGSNLFWGAKRVGDQLVGENVLGKLWMQIRESVKATET
jgi:ribA/ribD-fused uncharacterized protein